VWGTERGDQEVSVSTIIRAGVSRESTRFAMATAPRAQNGRERSSLEWLSVRQGLLQYSW